MLPLICPICRGALAPAASALKCPSGHSFDVSREGYVNLLTGPIPATMGDSREMLAARRAFLEQGHYRPLSDAVNALVAEHLRARVREAAPVYVGDVGCGEGYYLGRLQDHLGAELPASVADHFGADVSREAVRMAARRYKAARFVVADAWKLLPFADGVLTVLLSIFSPRNGPEFDRVLGPQGLLVVAVPEPGHLQELRHLEGFLGIQEDKREALLAQFGPRFPRLQERVLQYELALSRDDLGYLVGMTPSSRHLRPEALSALDAADGMSVTAAFRVLAFRR
ncbi:MAG: putative RNA methyltransferase [Anaerolineae bacterium]